MKQQDLVQALPNLFNHKQVWPSVIRFARLISEGAVNLDFTMSEKPNGRIADHGFLWRIKSDMVEELYLHSEEIDLEAPNKSIKRDC